MKFNNNKFLSNKQEIFYYIDIIKNNIIIN